jgi:hypothetical protein
VFLAFDKGFIMKRALLFMLITISAHADEKRIYQTDSVGNIQYNKPSHTIQNDGRINPQFPFITIVSLDQWAQKMNFFEPLPSEQLSEMSAIKTTSLQITFALLVEVLAKRAPEYRHCDGKPKVQVIANKILELIKDDKLDLPGQGSRSIQNCIRAALQIKNNHL